MDKIYFNYYYYSWYIKKYRCKVNMKGFLLMQIKWYFIMKNAWHYIKLSTAYIKNYAEEKSSVLRDQRSI